MVTTFRNILQMELKLCVKLVTTLLFQKQEIYLWALVSSKECKNHVELFTNRQGGKESEVALYFLL